MITQTPITGKPATREQIAIAFEDAGWRKVPHSATMLKGILIDTSWYHENAGVVLVDARPANVLIDDKGSLYPIDVMLAPEDEYLLQAIR